MTKPHVTIYSDGGAKPNPGGPGGWGVLLIYGDREKELSGGEASTTNNRMELTAACEALEALKQPCEVTFYTDSEYVQRGISEWLPGWIRRGWKTASRQPVKNQDLWERLHEATQRHDIEWCWVRGHDGNEHNERVDQLATKARLGVQSK
ncbi:MAG: ribonuclease HI [Anaerolineae bacterium]|nr:ribonuclease HI [Anaerolineae bacterium]